MLGWLLNLGFAGGTAAPVGHISATITLEPAQSATLSVAPVQSATLDVTPAVNAAIKVDNE